MEELYYETPFYLTGWFWLLYLGITLVLLAIAYKMSVSRGRNPLGWMVLTLFLGVLGILLLGLVGGNKPTSTARITNRARESRPNLPRQNASHMKQEVATTKRCPFCAEPIQLEATVCRYCNRELTPDQYCTLSFCNNVIDGATNLTASDGKLVCSEQHVVLRELELSGQPFTCSYDECGKSLTAIQAERYRGKDGKLFCSTFHAQQAINKQT